MRRFRLLALALVLASAGLVAARAAAPVHADLGWCDTCSAVGVPTATPHPHPHR